MLVLLTKQHISSMMIAISATCDTLKGYFKEESSNTGEGSGQFGVGFLLDQGGLHCFSDPNFFFMPLWQTFLLMF